MDTSKTLIKLTLDGRRVEVIVRAICLDELDETQALVENGADVPQILIIDG